MKRSIFDEQTSRALKKWRQAAKKRHKGSVHSPSITPITPSTSTVTSPSTSPLHQAYHSRVLQHLGRSQSLGLAYHSDEEISDPEMDNTSPTSTTNLIPSFKHKEVDVEAAEYRLTVEQHGDEDFSFVKTQQG